MYNPGRAGTLAPLRAPVIVRPDRHHGSIAPWIAMRLPARTGRTISGDPTHGNRAVATGRDCNRQALAGLLAERFPEMRQILRPGRFGTPVATLLRLADPARATLQAPA